MGDDRVTCILRPAESDEAVEIRRLVRSERLNPLGLDWQRFTIAEDTKGAIAGCVQVKRHFDGSREMASLVVTPQWRGRGIGACLVQQVQTKVGPPLWLMCRSELASYYEQFGFVAKQDAAELPPYFRRIFLPVRWLRRLLRQPPTLAVMLWDGRTGGASDAH